MGNERDDKSTTVDTVVVVEEEVQVKGGASVVGVVEMGVAVVEIALEPVGPVEVLIALLCCVAGMYIPLLETLLLGLLDVVIDKRNTGVRGVDDVIELGVLLDGVMIEEGLDVL